MSEWHKRFIGLAYHIAEWSKDPSTKVGAVIVRPDRTIASVGYNGFPRNVLDDSDRYETKNLKRLFVVHAEMNAIITAKEPLNGFSIYVSRLLPCSNCAGAIIQSGIKTVYHDCHEPPEHWKDSFTASLQMFKEAEINVRLV